MCSSVARDGQSARRHCRRGLRTAGGGLLGRLASSFVAMGSPYPRTALTFRLRFLKVSASLFLIAARRSRAPTVPDAVTLRSTAVTTLPARPVVSHRLPLRLRPHRRHAEAVAPAAVEAGAAVSPARRRRHHRRAVGAARRRRRDHLRLPDLHGRPLRRLPHLRRGQRRSAGPPAAGRTSSPPASPTPAPRAATSCTPCTTSPSSPPSTACTGSTWACSPAGTPPTAAETTSTGSASSWAPGPVQHDQGPEAVHTADIATAEHLGRPCHRGRPDLRRRAAPPSPPAPPDPLRRAGPPERARVPARRRVRPGRAVAARGRVRPGGEVVGEAATNSSSVIRRLRRGPLPEAVVEFGGVDARPAEDDAVLVGAQVPSAVGVGGPEDGRDGCQRPRSR